MKILIADDDRVTRELLGRTLKNAGYEVLFAEDGLDAVEGLQQRNQRSF